ncbi:MAG: type II secretion system protein [archaeon]|jgi:prepilin-type N-terminal cleavage/methylation domain-containing protein
MRIFHDKQKGFTLVEMLVAIAVFMSIMVIAAGSIVNIINQNKKAQKVKSVIDNVTFALDSISREVRMGTEYRCSVNEGVDFLDECDGSGGIYGKYFEYKNQSGASYVQYRFVSAPENVGDGNIQQRTCTSPHPNCSGTWQSITAPTSTVNITNMTFYVLGTGTEDLPAGSKEQPRVIITAEGLVVDKDGTETKFSLQTTVSQRVRQSYY